MNSQSDTQNLHPRALSAGAIDLIPFWQVGVPSRDPIKGINSNLRIATIVSQYLFDGLRFEGELLLLTPDNGRRTLKYGRPDLLLVESTWETVTGHWYLAQSTPGLEADALRDLIEYARRLGIPTVFWFTEDHAYHDHYRGFATNFDYIFCADPIETGLFNADGVRAFDLAPCVQPAVYNPFRRNEEYNSLELGVLFDGWGDLDRSYKSYENVLKAIRDEYNLSVIESRYLLTHNRLKTVGSLSSSILGCATQEGRILALKYAKAIITFDSTLSTPTTQRWESLQSAASYCPGVHFGILPENDIRREIVQHFDADLDGLVELVRMKEDDLYRQRIAHRAWRSTLQSHTFSHRMRYICETVGVRHDWEEYPKASVITPTCRPDMVPDAVQSFRKQSYPNRELILVYNGNRVEDLPTGIEAEDIRVKQVPGDLFAGAALNLGAQFAKGDFCFRMDDDDLYGNNYLLDMMLWQRCTDAWVWGKAPVPLKFENEPEVLMRPGSWKPFQLINPKHLHEGRVWICGNSIAFNKDSNKGLSYRDFALGAADTFFNSEIPKDAIVIILDIFNDVAVRRSEIESHTWRPDQEALKKTAAIYPSVEDLEI